MEVAPIEPSTEGIYLEGHFLPKFCECGGEMEYDFSLGRVWSCCKVCTPVVKVDRLDLLAHPPAPGEEK